MKLFQVEDLSGVRSLVESYADIPLTLGTKNILFIIAIAPIVHLFSRTVREIESIV